MHTRLQPAASTHLVLPPDRRFRLSLGLLKSSPSSFQPFLCWSIDVLQLLLLCPYMAVVRIVTSYGMDSSHVKSTYFIESVSIRPTTS